MGETRTPLDPSAPKATRGDHYSTRRRHPRRDTAAKDTQKQDKRAKTTRHAKTQGFAPTPQWLEGRRGEWDQHKTLAPGS
jgi:hypothetical protein